MQRRSRSKVMVNHNENEQKMENQMKQQEQQDTITPKERVKFLKENLVISLASYFLQNKNDPSQIYPWMKDFKQLQEKILGRNYIIQGPSQSGKYSSVKYAISQSGKKIIEILVNCDVYTTEHQIYQKLVDEFTSKCKKCDWPSKYQINKVFSPQNIEFQKLTPYLIKGKIDFVIVIKNAEHLFGFKNQSILYNLFEWMRNEKISSRGGTVLISRDIRLTDKFQKRVKSRFCGTRLCIFRPQKAQVYTKIITKRIEALIQKKSQHYRQLRMFNPDLLQEQQEIYQSDQEINVKSKKRGRTPKKVNHQQKAISFEDIIQNKQTSKYMKQMDEYIKSLQTFLTLDVFYQLQINQELIQTAMELEKIKSKKKGSQLFTEESLLKLQDQLECLRKLKQAFQKNGQLEDFLEQKIMNNQVITIPFVLMVLQHIFIRLDEILIKYLPVKKLKKLVLIMFKKNVQYQFPMHDMQGNSLQNLNNVDIMFLTLIYTLISQKRSSVKLTTIYEKYKNLINTQINNSYNRSVNTLPILLVERSIQSLWRNRIVTYDLYNLWNSEIKLIYSLAKTKLGLQMIASNRQITQMMKGMFQEANIRADYKIKQKKN